MSIIEEKLYNRLGYKIRLNQIGSMLFRVLFYPQILLSYWIFYKEGKRNQSPTL